MSLTATATGTAPALIVTVTAAAAQEFPIYFETGWGVLSSVNLLLIGISIMVVGIVGLNRLSVIPVLISTVSCLANGLCYYVYYTTYPPRAQRAAAGAANVFWGIQEIGTPFYSYFILKKILKDRQRRFFLYVFWALTLVLVGIRTAITVLAVTALADRTSKLGPKIDRLHNANFAVLAFVETMSAFFLLKTFYHARKRSKGVDMDRKASLFQHLARSTEIRLATLAVIGIMRACTYSFANFKESGKNESTQLDRFAAIMLNIFPVIMMVDLLSARVSHTASQMYTSAYPDYDMRNGGSIETGDTLGAGPSSGLRSKNRQSRGPNGMVDTIANDFGEYMGPHFERTAERRGRNGSLAFYETQGGGQTMVISPVAYSLGTLPDVKEYPYTKAAPLATPPS